MKKIVLLYFIFFMTVAFSQTKVDSLKAEFAKAETPEERIELLINLAFENEDDIEVSSVYYKEAIRIAKDNKLMDEEVNALIQLAYFYERHNKKEKAQKLYDESVNVASQYGEDDLLGLSHYYYGLFLRDAFDNYYEAEVYIKSAISYFQSSIASLKRKDGVFFSTLFKKDKTENEKKREDAIGNLADSYSSLAGIQEQFQHYEKALYYYMQALNVIKETDDGQLTLSITNRIAGLYGDIRQFAKSINYYEEALEIAEEIKDEEYIAVLNNNIGLIYSDMKEYDQARKYLERSIYLEKQLGGENLKNRLATTYNNLGTIYMNLNDYFTAEKYFRKALEGYIIEEDKASYGNTELNLGQVLLKKVKLEEAENLLYSGMEKVSKEVDLRAYTKGIKFLSQLKTAQKKYKEAYDYMQEYIDLKEKMFSEETKQKIAEMQANLELEKKNKEIKIKTMDIERNNQIIRIIMIVGFLVLSLLLYLAFIYQKKNKIHGLLVKSNNELQASYNELKKAQDEIINLEKKNSVLAMIVTTNHELNQPLMILKGNLEMLMLSFEKEKLKGKQERYLNRINKAIDRVNSILQTYKEAEHFDWDEYVEDTEMVVIKGKDEEENE